MADAYEERLKKEIQEDIEKYNKTGQLPREYDVRRVKIKESKSKKKEKIEYGKEIE